MNKLVISEFGKLTKIDQTGCEHPQWIWEIDNRKITFTTKEIMSYQRVFRKCLTYSLDHAPDVLHVSWPHKVSKDQWRGFVNKALARLRGEEGNQ